jgi:hypothetical protein
MSTTIPSHPLLSDLPTPPQDAKLRMPTMKILMKIHPLLAKDSYADMMIRTSQNKIEKLQKDIEIWKLRKEGYANDILCQKKFLKRYLCRDLGIDSEDES